MHHHDEPEPDADDALPEGLLEAIRAVTEGELPSAELAAALAAIEAAGAVALLEAYRDVHAATSLLAGPASECAVTLADVERATSARRPLRRLWGLRSVRVAAALLVVAGVAAAVWPHDVVPTVALAFAEETARVSPEAAAAERSAALLAEYQPVRDGEPQWIDDPARARDVAAVTGRRVLLFAQHPQCPWCQELRGKTFHDAGVQARLERFVPLMVDVTRIPEGEAVAYLAKGWPYFAALDAAGDELAALPGPASSTQEFTGRLDRTLGKVAPDAAGEREWGPVRASAQRLRAAAALAEGDDLAGAERELRELVAADGDGAFGAAARTRLAELGNEALAVVRDAERKASTDVSGALALLEAAVRRFAGTSWGRDLDAVRSAVEEHGRFPRLVFPVSGDDGHAGDRK